MPTKEQERKALEKIEKILMELGNNPETSYICRAFQGCVDDAKTNIEFDFGNSQKDRADDLEKKLSKARADLEQAETERDTARANALDEKARDTYYNFFQNERREAERQARLAAAEMLEACENTESDEYKKALENAQRMKRRAARLLEMLKALPGATA